MPAHTFPIETTHLVRGVVQPRRVPERRMSGPPKEHRVINSNSILRQAGLAAAIVISVLSLAGCGKGAAGKSADADKTTAMLISPEDLLTVTSNAMATGPSITGSIEPERRADL